MTGILDYIKLDSDGNTQALFPITVTNGIYIGSNTSGKTLDSYLNHHEHNMIDIIDLNVSEDGQIIFKTLTLLLNDNVVGSYNGMGQVDFNVSLATLGAASEDHNHEGVYSRANHVHSEYAPLTHKHTMSDLTDYTPGTGGSGEIEPLTIQINGFSEVRFDGTSPQTLDITLAKLGAASSNHTHTISNVTGFGSFTIRLKNDDLIVYTPTSSIELDLTPDSIGAALKEHEHNYAAMKHFHDEYSRTGHTHGLSALPVGLSTGYITSGMSPSLDPINILGNKSTIEGSNNIVSGDYSHAEGHNNFVYGDNSHAGGEFCRVPHGNSFVHGISLSTSNQNQTVFGRYNKNHDQRVFIIGNGSAGGPADPEGGVSNAFSVHHDGDVYAAGNFNSSGADYGEYFEWLDSNPNKEDRIGLFVALKGKKILLANSSDDYIIGAISGTASIVGNAQDDQWVNMYLRDEYGRLVHKDVEREIDGKTTIETVQKLNPDFDASLTYVPRSERPEWDIVGMFGVLTVRDDGTSEVDSYCKVSTGGIATASTEGYRVLERVTDNIVKILYRGR